jgi:glycerol-3-phosphate acyltransferase PlsX
MRLGLDAMGGDFAPQESIKGAQLFHQDFPEVELTLFGNKEEIDAVLKAENITTPFHVVHCPDHIEMKEHAARAVASKKESSITIGVQALAKGKIDCFIGAGNTGAMLVSSVLILKNIEGVERPTITSILPRPNGKDGIILDVGANADCKPNHLLQFGILGSIYAEKVNKINKPRVALLNIGEEKEKGNQLSQAAYQLLDNEEAINFVGNIEGRNLFDDSIADVVVCDGFTGNNILKTCEGLYYHIIKSGAESPFLKRFNFNDYGGTSILGVQGNVIVGHGISKANTFYQMLKQGMEVSQSQLVENIKSSF